MPELRPGRSKLDGLWGLTGFGTLALVGSMVGLPWVFDSSLALGLMSQMGIAIVACLSYHLLLGQGGLLSFGHAVYTGLGAYLAIHALKAVGAGDLALPVSLIPLVGGLAGLGVAAVLGHVTTARAGTPFAMITLGVGEMVLALALMFPAVFGGEAGVSADRVVGPPLLGITFGPPGQVYTLLALYTLACLALVRAFTATPLGRLLNAVRDNPLRVGFLGHDPRMVRYLAFLVAGFVAGVSGGMAALHFELVSTEVLSASRSGAYLLFTFLGGVAHLGGAVAGGVLMVLATVVWSKFTQAWMLYLGCFFMLIILAAPQGLVGGLLGLGQRLRAGGPWPSRRVWGPALAGAVLAALGLGALVEMAYHLQLASALGPGLSRLGVGLDVSRPLHWLTAGGLALVGLTLLAQARRGMASAPSQPATRAAVASTVLGSLPPRSSLVSPAGEGVTTSTGRMQGRAAPALPVASGPTCDAPVVLSVKGLGKRFGRTEVLRGLNLSVRQGERLAVIGPNGAGKSTLFHLLSGHLAPSVGEIHLPAAAPGRRVQGRPPHALHRLGLARSFQISQLFGRLSVHDHLRCAALWPLGHRYTAWRRLDALHDVTRRADEVMALIRLSHRRDVPAMHLSYAEQRALDIGLALVSDAPVLLLDEPTAGMSRSETEAFLGLLREATAGRTLLVVEHDMSVVFALADRIAVLVQGELLALDTPQAVRADPRVRAAYLGSWDAGA